MGKKSSPKAPDYAGAAEAQGEANKESALQTAYLSNPNVNNTYGSQTVDFKREWDKDGNPTTPYQPTITQTLSPTEQAKYDQGSALDLGLLDTAQGGLDRVDDMMGTSFDMNGMQGVQSVQSPAQAVSGPNSSGLPQLQNINTNQLQNVNQFQRTDPNDINRVNTQNLDPYSTEASVGGLQQVTDAIRSRGDVDFADKRQSLDNDLRIRGFTPGSEGFRREMQGLERQQNDFNQQALLAGGQEQSRINSYEQARRGQGLNEQLQQQTADQSFGQQGFDQQERVAQFQQSMRAQGMSEQAIQSQIAAANRGQEFGERTTQAGFDQTESQRGFRNQQDLQAAQGAERQRQIQEQAYLRQLPLNEINALRSGQQVNNPQFQQYSGAQVAPAPLFQAAQAQGNYDLGAAGSGGDLMGGLFQLGGSALGSGMFNGMMGGGGA